MTNVATAPKDKRKIMARRLLAHSYYGLHRVLRSLSGEGEKQIKTVAIYPRIDDISILADIVNRLSWYLPNSPMSNIVIRISVAPGLIDESLDALITPASQNRYIDRPANISLVDSNSLGLSSADIILLWNSNKMFSPHILRHLSRVYIVDPNFYHSFEAFTYPRLLKLTLSNESKKKLLEQSKNNYARLTRETSECRRGYVFGTGPSLEKAYDFDFDGGVKVICNTMVKNQPLLRHIKPQLIVFLDAVHHYSPSIYSAEFRNMVIRTVNNFDCYVMVPIDFMPLMLAHYPELESKIIGMLASDIHDMGVGEIIKMLVRKPRGFFSRSPELISIPGHSARFNFPTPEKMYLMKSTSVLTSHMVPVASAMVDEIFFIGADGRKRGEYYFWSYDKSSQFRDLMQTLFDTHPSFFRDADYEDYYEAHCQYFEDLLSYGEALGKKYYSLTPSYIPALDKRQAPLDKIKKAR